MTYFRICFFLGLASMAAMLKYPAQDTVLLLPMVTVSNCGCIAKRGHIL